jgi:Zn2+/Cd2+-exporting ATPase
MRKKLVFETLLIGALIVSLTIPWYAKGSWNVVLFIVLSVMGAVPVAISALKAIAKKKISVDLLASVALGFSFVAGEWHSAVFITLMLAFARLFDVWTEQKAKDTISKMMKYLPERVKIRRGDDVVEIGLTEVKPGDLVMVEEGERVPVDGVVVFGQASINESTLTGESEPVVRRVHDMVYSSTLNENGSLVIRAEKVGKDSRLTKMAALVEEASRKKSKSEMFADKFAQWYVIGMLSFAILGYFFLGNHKIVLAILLVVCADDIAVAIPLTFTMAIARGARMGMIIKGSEVIEKMAKIKQVVTDKTGTLTLGKPRVVDAGNRMFLRELGMTAGSSNHPVSRAIAEYVQKQGEEILATDEFSESPGEGTKVVMKGKTWYLGKPDYVRRQGVEINAEQNRIIEEAADRGYGISVLGEEKKVVSIVKLEDEVKPMAREAIYRTKELGIVKWWMLTGDNTKVAGRVSQEVGIDQFEANLTPEQKISWVEKINKQEQGVVAMIGDGVNDAAALALADVSIAMGAIGSDAAIEAADVALVRDNLDKIPQAMELGRQVLRIMKQEFVIWGTTNAIGLALVLTGRMDPAWAAAYNFLTDFFPIVNALRLGVWNPRRGADIPGPRGGN